MSAPVVAGLVGLLVGGCNGKGLSIFQPKPAETPTEQTSAPEADEVFASVQSAPSADGTGAAPLPTIDARLRVVKVQISRAERDKSEALWKHLREDAVDGETALRLRRNGLRVGIGRTDWWSPVKEAIDGIPNRRVDELNDLRIPPGFPLGLELDADAREQTLFYMDDDGILSGSTWPESRNVLRLLYAVDERKRGLLLQVMPEVRQRLTGFRYVRTEAGVWQVPRGGGREFPAASFNVRLEPGEFLLIAPSASADVYGTIGGAFLTEEGDGHRHDTLLFLRPELTNGSQRTE